MNMELICNSCELSGFCKYYKALKSNTLKNMFIPDFLMVEVYNGKMIIIDCDKYKSIYYGGNYEF